MALTNASLRPKPKPNVILCGCDGCNKPAVVTRFDSSGLCLRHATEFLMMKGKDFDAKHYKVEP